MIDNFEDDKNAYNDSMVFIWSGALTDIPPGFVLCDGNNGTPDLTDQMLRGTPVSAPNVGATGGADSYTISSSQMSNHSHGTNVGSSGGHRHGVSTLQLNKDSNSNFQREKYSSGTESVSSTNGSHSHSYNTNNTGSGSSVDNRPSYYRVAFIMNP